MQWNRKIVHSELSDANLSHVRSMLTMINRLVVMIPSHYLTYTERADPTPQFIVHP